MTWGGYTKPKAGDFTGGSGVAEPEKEKPEDTLTEQERHAKAAAQAHHYANMEADELERQRMLSEPPRFDVWRYPAGDFLVVKLPGSSGEMRDELIPRTHIEKIEILSHTGQHGTQYQLGQAPCFWESQKDNDHEVRMAEISPHSARVAPKKWWEFKSYEARGAVVRIIMSSGRHISVPISRHYPEITIAALRKAWLEQEAVAP